jgi:membrane-bound lytic murein transglycosylase B
MNKHFVLLLLIAVFSISKGNAQPAVDQSLIDQFVDRHAMIYKISPEEVRSILAKAELKPDIIQKMERPAEKRMTWERYRKIFMTEERIAAGVDFWKEHETTLVNVSYQTGVPIHIILGIIGVETYFGRIKGSYNVLDALYTLSFAFPRRSKYFQSELDEFLALARKENLDLYTTKGSYAGAMGYCQFMPSSYRAYAKSYDEGGTRDLVNSPEDAIASVANYLKVHGWKKGETVAFMAKESEASLSAKQSLKPKQSIAYYQGLGFEPSIAISSQTKATLQKMEKESGDEYWFGLQNFYVITRYNHSPLYALAVYQLAEAIKANRG